VTSYVERVVDAELMEMAADIGDRRWANGERINARNRFPEQGWSAQVDGHVRGALGEATFCQWVDVFWPMSIRAIRHPDVYVAGVPYEIKTPARHTDPLRIRDDPKYVDGTWFVLVTGTGPIMRIHGRISLADALAHPMADPGGRGLPCHIIPQADLVPPRVPVGAS